MRFSIKQLISFFSCILLASGFALSPPAHAGIMGYLIVHNTTSQTLSIYVNGDQFRGRVSAGSVAKYLIGAEADALTTFGAFSPQGELVKSGHVSGNIGDYEWWVQ